VETTQPVCLCSFTNKLVQYRYQRYQNKS